jgi:Tetratricopeptide repeat
MGSITGDSWDAGRLHAMRGQLLARRGDFAGAREQLDLALRRSSPSDHGEAWIGLVELGLWEGRDDDLGTGVARGQRWYAEMGADRVGPLLWTSWCVLLLRMEADRGELAAARRASEETAKARRRAAALAAELNRLATEPQAAQPNVAGNLLLAQAEQPRLEGAADPERWQAAAATWERLERPFDAAYARFRQAEALLASRAPRAEVEQVLPVAHRTAIAVGAEPLRQEIELLAQPGLGT